MEIGKIIFLIFLLAVTLTLLLLQIMQPYSSKSRRAASRNQHTTQAPKETKEICNPDGEIVPDVITVYEIDDGHSDDLHPSRRAIVKALGLTDEFVNMTFRLQCQITVGYEDKYGALTDRKVDVTGFYPEHECVEGYCHLRKDARTFALERIKSAEDSDGQAIRIPLQQYFVEQYINHGRIQEDKSEWSNLLRAEEDESKRKLATYEKLSDFEEKAKDALQLNLFLTAQCRSLDGELVDAEIETYYVSMGLQSIYGAFRETDLTCGTHATSLAFSQIETMFDETGEPVEDVAAYFAYRLRTNPKYVAQRLWKHKRNTIRSLLFFRERGFIASQKKDIFLLLPAALHDTFSIESYEAIFNGRSDEKPGSLQSFKICVSKALSQECADPQALRDLFNRLSGASHSDNAEIEAALSFVERKFIEVSAGN